MAISNLHYLPISVFILFPSTFLGTQVPTHILYITFVLLLKYVHHILCSVKNKVSISGEIGCGKVKYERFLDRYIAAVLLGHVEPEFPYISDDATYSPESCVFGQLINMGSVLLCLVIYIRYCEVVQFFEDYSTTPAADKLNRSGLWLGIISSFGLSLVANFQETNVIYVHFAGALLCFGVGTIYFWVQAILSYRMHPIAHGLGMARFRVFLSFITTVLFFVIVVTGVISHLQFHGDNPRKWHPEDGGWVLHAISTISEWIVAICFCLYILSFSPEFQEITFTHPQIFLKMGRHELVHEHAGDHEDVMS